jgi:hypothetical protein
MIAKRTLKNLLVHPTSPTTSILTNHSWVIRLKWKFRDLKTRKPVLISVFSQSHFLMMQLLYYGEVVIVTWYQFSYSWAISLFKYRHLSSDSEWGYFAVFIEETCLAKDPFSFPSPRANLPNLDNNLHSPEQMSSLWTWKLVSFGDTAIGWQYMLRTTHRGC